jgi:hypothetical protein
MRVEVAAPEVSGETVRFRWAQTEPNPYQSENGFFLRYEGIDLGRFSATLFYEVFLGLQLKVFAAYGTPVEVVFPEPVPRQTVAFWQMYHDAEHVTITPTADVGSYSPWTAGCAPESRQRSIGVLFGGGKDSTLATCLLAESYSADEVVLFHLISPHRPGTELAERLEQRQEELMLCPARERLGVATQRAWTDYLAQHHRSDFRARPHLELYTVGLLPAFLAWGVSVCTTSHSWTSYGIRRLENGRVWFHYAKSRPEMLATQSTHYRRVLGSDIALTNLNLLFTGFAAFRLLAERYPEEFKRVVMCVGAEVGARWCYRCKKCAGYALFSLAHGLPDPRFDYNRFYSRAPSIQQLVRYIKSGVERSVYGNVPWVPAFSPDVRYLIDCHAYAIIPYSLIAGVCQGKALTNLLLVKAAFGNTTFPTYGCIPAKAIELLDHESARRAAGIAARHLDVVDPLTGPFLNGNVEVEYDFGVRMSTKTGQLDHIRA